MSKELIPVARPLLGREEVSAAERAILSGWVTQGPEVAAFEKEFAGFVGRNPCLRGFQWHDGAAPRLLAVGVRAGDEVITVSHSSSPPPIASDIAAHCPYSSISNRRPSTLIRAKSNLRSASALGRSYAFTRWVCRVTCRLFWKLPNRHKIRVIEVQPVRSAAKFSGREIGKKIGKPHADVACFSFHPRKLLTTGDAGCLPRAMPEIDRKFRLWRQHSMSTPDTEGIRHQRWCSSLPRNWVLPTA